MTPVMPPRKNKDLTTTSTKLREVTEPGFGDTTLATPATRAEKRRESAANVNAVDIDTVFSKLFELIGQTDISTPDPDISPLAIDTLAAELLAVRDAKDVIEGRESALKAYTTEVINNRIVMTGDSPADTSGYLVSPENGVKLSKEVSGGKLNIDIILLEKELDEDQFRAVVNHVVIMKTVNTPDGNHTETTDAYFELNEEALEKQLRLGNIGMEQIVKATTPGKTRSAFYVRAL